jgi:hypothetical protein
MQLQRAARTLVGEILDASAVEADRRGQALRRVAARNATDPPRQKPTTARRADRSRAASAAAVSRRNASQSTLAMKARPRSTSAGE